MLLQFMVYVPVVPGLIGFVTGAGVMLLFARNVLQHKKKRITQLHQKLREMEETNMDLMEDMGMLREFIASKGHTV